MKPYANCTPEQVARRREYLRRYISAHPLTLEQRANKNARVRARYANNREDNAAARWAAIKAREDKDPSARERRLAKKREHARLVRIKDPAAHKQRKREWRRKWRKTEDGRAKSKELLRNPTTKLRHAIRHRAWLVLHGKKKMAPTLSYLGCSVADLRAHLESSFKPGMSWDNHGVLGWHIDHKRPLASFELIRSDGTVNEDELRLAMHFTNLQPLWYWENASKGASVA